MLGSGLHWPGIGLASGGERVGIRLSALTLALRWNQAGSRVAIRPGSGLDRVGVGLESGWELARIGLASG